MVPDPVIRLSPCNDFQIVISIDSLLLSHLSLSVSLAFPQDLKVPSRKKIVTVNPSDRNKTLSLRFHVHKDLVWPKAMNLGVITVTTDETTFLWQSLPLAIMAGNSSECDTYLGIKV